MSTIHLTDGYKLDHRRQYPKGTSLVLDNFTPRKSRMKGVEKIVNFGLQYFLVRYLIDDFNNNFFNKPKEEVVAKYTRRINNYLGPNQIGTAHIEALHDLGYLPIEVKALPEGVVVPIRVPVYTIVSTKDEFFWIPNYIETLISCVTWMPMTSATIAKEYRRIFDYWAEKTGGDKTFVQFQGHDFSMRGMAGLEAAEMSGAAHLLSFVGTDTVPAIDFLEKYYGADSDRELVGCSVAATEHSVMCAGSKEGELETFKRLITEIYPSGIVSIVSDTWDLWTVLGSYLPLLKDVILARDGKVVIRPDSGDPVKIITGYIKDEVTSANLVRDMEGQPHLAETEIKGVVETLWDIFGGTEVQGADGKMYKVLDPHIGCIYGDSITPDRANQICERLAAKGFASTNWVAGIGSYTYQYNTRDTFGFAMKATYVEITHNDKFVDETPDSIGARLVPYVEGREIFKSPSTDKGGEKKSAKGIIAVYKDEVTGEYYLQDQATWEQYNNCELKTVFRDGKLIVKQTLSEIRERLAQSK